MLSGKVWLRPVSERLRSETFVPRPPTLIVEGYGVDFTEMLRLQLAMSPLTKMRSSRTNSRHNPWALVPSNVESEVLPLSVGAGAGNASVPP